MLLNYGGWKAKVLEENGCGYGCKLFDVDEFVEKVIYLYSHKELLVEMGHNARKLAVEKYDRQKLSMQALEVVTSLQD